MKYFIIILGLGIMSCSDNSTGKVGNTENGTGSHDHDVTILETNKKWNADSATKQNVARIVAILDSAEANKNNSKANLAISVQAGLDSLIKDCRMKGEDHDALHVWLEDVLKKVKELKEDDDEYKEAYANLRSSVESFYEKFQ